MTRRVLDDLQRLNARMPAAQALPIPKEATLSRAISRRIAQLDPWEVDRQRWGRQIADRRHAPTSPQCLARRILERVEVDHTPLKVVVGTDSGPIGQFGVALTPLRSLAVDLVHHVGNLPIWLDRI